MSTILQSGKGKTNLSDAITERLKVQFTTECTSKTRKDISNIMYGNSNIKINGFHNQKPKKGY